MESGCGIVRDFCPVFGNDNDFIIRRDFCIFAKKQGLQLSAQQGNLGNVIMDSAGVWQRKDIQNTSDG